VETRALIAFVLSISILVGYQLLLGPRPPTASDPAATTVQQATEPSSPRPRQPFLQLSLRDRSRDRGRAGLNRSRPLSPWNHPAGGRLESFRLNAYRRDSDTDSPALDMVDPDGPLPLGVYWTRPDGSVVSDQGMTYTFGRFRGIRRPLCHRALGCWTRRGTPYEANSRGPDSYSLEYEVEVKAGYDTSIGVGWSHRVPQGHDRFSAMEGPAVYLDGALEHVAAADLAEPVTRKGRVDWAGYADHYFLSAYYPERTMPLRFSAAVAGGYAESTLWSDGPTQQVAYGSTSARRSWPSCAGSAISWKVQSTWAGSRSWPDHCSS